MRDYDYDAMVFDGEVYCVGCLPSSEDENFDIEEEAGPIFAGSEWDYAPSCCVCGEVHDYMSILGED